MFCNQYLLGFKFKHTNTFELKILEHVCTCLNTNLGEEAQAP